MPGTQGVDCQCEDPSLNDSSVALFICGHLLPRFETISSTEERMTSPVSFKASEQCLRSKVLAQFFDDFLFEVAGS